MKKLLFISLVLILTACTNEKKSQEKFPVVSEELFQMKLSSDSIYGVRLRLSTNQPKEFLGVAVSLYQNEKVWLDTVLTELRKGDTIESEVIFSSAKVVKGSQPTVKTETFAVE